MRKFPIYVFSAAILFAQEAQQQQNAVPPTGTLAGRVVNSLTGEGIKKANIELQPGGPFLGGRPPAPVNGTTDADGRFQLNQIADGTYSIRASHQSFPPSRQLLTRNEFQRVTIGGNNPTKEVTLTLVPGGSISGKMLDADGDPLSGYVQLMEPNMFGGPMKYNPVNGASVDENGAFRFPSVPPGRYLLMARPGQQAQQVHGLMTQSELLKLPKLTYVPVYFPNTDSVDSAEPVSVTAGGTVEGLEMRISPVLGVSVAGKIIYPGAPGSSPTYANLNLVRRNADSSLDMSPLAFGAVMPDRSFTLPAVPPGSYVLLSNNETPDSAYYVRQPIEVGRQAILDVELRMRAAADFPLTVSIEEPDTPPAPGSPNLSIGGGDPVFVRPTYFSFGGFVMPRFKKLPDGTFILQRVVPGKFQIIPRTAGYVKSMRWGDKQISGPMLEVTGEESGPLTILISRKMAAVNGSVQGYEAGKQISVVLVPESDDLASMGEMRMAGVQAGGKFQISVAPGRYIAFCAEEGSQQYARNPAFRTWLKQNATILNVEVEGTPVPILPLIRRETIEQALLEAQQRRPR